MYLTFFHHLPGFYLDPQRDMDEGKVTSNLTIAGESDNFLTANENGSLAESLKQFWTAESIGILDSELNGDTVCPANHVPIKVGTG